MSYPADIYHSPEKFGLTIVGEVEEDGLSYEFNTFVVWRNGDNVLFMANDSGCSCPSPFEAYTSVDKLERINSLAQFSASLDEWNQRYGGGPRTDVSAFRKQVGDLLR